MEILRWLLIILSVPVLIVMVLQTRKRARALSERIEEYHEEQEASQSTPANPYESLASLYGSDPDNNPRPR